MGVHYLQHPIHGQIACGDLDASVALANGWTEFNLTEGREAPQEPLPAFLGGPSDLPPDFPGREALIEAGLTTWAVVQHKTRDELLAVKGIGPKTADDIARALDV